MAEGLYNQILSDFQIRGPNYGVVMRRNKSGQAEISKDVQSEFSIFDDDCFVFYLVKYCEILGKEALISLLDDKSGALKISYYKKTRIIEYIIDEERNLGVEESSWKHCLLFLYINGILSPQ